MTKKKKRIILICIAGLYSLSVNIFLAWYYRTYLEGRFALEPAIVQYLLTIPSIIMVWIMVHLLNEPKLHIIRIIFKVAAILATIVLIYVLLFNLF
jgi:hypothetical protein